MMDWINEPAFGAVRRIDVALIVAGFGCVAYYGYIYGPIGALKGGVAFVMAMVTGWLLRVLFVDR